MITEYNRNISVIKKKIKVTSLKLSLKASLHFQSFCSPIKALKVEFISTFRNERKRSRSLNIIVQ